MKELIEILELENQENKGKLSKKVPKNHKKKKMTIFAKTKDYEPIDSPIQSTYEIDDEGGELDDEIDLGPPSDELGPGLTDLPDKNQPFPEDSQTAKEAYDLFENSAMAFKTPYSAADIESDDEDSDSDGQEDSPVEDPYDID